MTGKLIPFLDLFCKEHYSFFTKFLLILTFFIHIIKLKSGRWIVVIIIRSLWGMDVGQDHQMWDFQNGIRVLFLN